MPYVPVRFTEITGVRHVNLTKAQFGYLQWIGREGGVATLERGAVCCGGNKSSNASAISFLNLVVKGALEAKDGKLVITDYGRRLLTP